MAKTDLTRRRAIRGQIETAIELVLFEKDAASAHVLTLAASDVLRSLLKHAGKESLHVQVERLFRPERMKDWITGRKLRYNFFKHADRDPEVESVAFDPESTDLELSAAIQDYVTLYGGMSLPMAIFNAYLVTVYPSMFLEAYRESMGPALDNLDIDSRSPRDAAARYLSVYLEGGFKDLKAPLLEI